MKDSIQLKFRQNYSPFPFDITVDYVDGSLAVAVNDDLTVCGL